MATRLQQNTLSGPHGSCPIRPYCTTSLYLRQSTPTRKFNRTTVSVALNYTVLLTRMSYALQYTISLLQADRRNLQFRNVHEKQRRKLCDTNSQNKATPQRFAVQPNERKAHQINSSGAALAATYFTCQAGVIGVLEGAQLAIPTVPTATVELILVAILSVTVG